MSETNLDYRNEFVFNTVNEFIEFQKMFVDEAAEILSTTLSDGKIINFYPSNLCDYVRMTFKYCDEPYLIINNLSLCFKGFREIVIKGSRSNFTGKRPVLKVYNENASNARKYYRMDGQECHSYGNDDAIFNIQNEHTAPTNVFVSDLEIVVDFDLSDVEGFRLYEHWYDLAISPVMFKVHEAQTFKMFNVKLYSQFLDLTHIFLHWCENVEITNCEFTNYNARKIGGILWFWDTAKNVKIVNNDFRKYGNDEILAFWGSSVYNRDVNNFYSTNEAVDVIDVEEDTDRQVRFESILIKNNRFFYGRPVWTVNAVSDPLTPEPASFLGFPGVLPDLGEEPVPLENTFPVHVEMSEIIKKQQNKWLGDNIKEENWNGVVDVLNALYFSQDTKRVVKHADEHNNIISSLLTVPYVHYHISNFMVGGNEYYIDSPLTVLWGIHLDDFCLSNDIRIMHNVIKYGPWRGENVQLQNFRVFYDRNIDGWDVVNDLGNRNKINLDPVVIENNTIESACLPYMVYEEREEEHIILNIENAAVSFNNNIVKENNRKVNSTDQGQEIVPVKKNSGFMILYSRSKGGIVTMKNNAFHGMKYLASLEFEASRDFSQFNLNVVGNFFHGGTTLYTKYLNGGNFIFENNRFFVEVSTILFHNLPQKAIVVLNNNVIKRIFGEMDSSTNGTLYFSDNDPQIEQEDVRFFSSNNIYVQLNESVFPQNDGKKLIVESANDRFVGIELTPALPPVGISSRHLNSSSGTAS